jgi:hypothetical protein
MTRRKKLSISQNSGDEVELDFSTTDRVAQHLAEDAENEDFVEVPVWHETGADLLDLYSYESVLKALKLIRDKKVWRVEGRPDLFNVQGSQMYVARIIDLGEESTPGVTCTCPNGANRAGRPTCFHSLGALIGFLGGQHPKVKTMVNKVKAAQGKK